MDNNEKHHWQTLKIKEFIQNFDKEGVFEFGGDGDEGELLLDALDGYFNKSDEIYEKWVERTVDEWFDEHRDIFKF